MSTATTDAPVSESAAIFAGMSSRNLERVIQFYRREAENRRISPKVRAMIEASNRNTLEMIERDKLASCPVETCIE